MRVLVVFFLLGVNVVFAQMDDYNRLKAAAEIAFGYEEEVYPDTFYVQDFRRDTAELYLILEPYDPKLGHSKHLVYRRADSSALTGTVIIQKFGPHEYYVDNFIQGYSFVKMHYENGRIKKSINKQYSKFSKTFFKEEPQYNNTLFDPEKNGFHLFGISGSRYTIRYDYNGKISSLSYESGYDEAENYFSEYFELFENGQIKSHHNYKIKDKIVYDDNLEFNEAGDTLELVHTGDARRQGIWVKRLHPMHDGSSLKLRSTWRDDTLLDVLNSNILFIDHKQRVISEQQFREQLEHQFYSFSWEYRLIPEKIRLHFDIPYTAVLCTDRELDFYFLLFGSSLIETDEEIMGAFLKKNRKRIEALGGRKNNL